MDPVSRGSAGQGPIWRVLGEPRLPWQGSDLARQIGKKAVGLIAYIAVAPGGAGRDELAELLWPGTELARSKHSLRQCLVVLRKVLGTEFDSVLEVSEHRISLGKSVEVDARRLVEIECLGAAPPAELLDLCRGPFLRGLFTRSRPFDDWAAGQRQRLSAIASRALNRALQAAEQAERGAEASRIAAALAEIEANPEALRLPPTHSPTPDTEQARQVRIMLLARRALAGIGAAALVAAAIWLGLSLIRIDEVGPPRISVLPFTSLNQKVEEARLAGGITLGVNYALYAITERELFVVTPTIEPLGEADPFTRATELGVRYLIIGTVEIFRDEVRVDVQCLDAESRSLAWHERFQKKIAEAFSIQDDITLMILKELDIELSTAERNRIQYLDDTTNLDAWLAAANGVKHLIRVTREDVAIAQASYLRALELDPGYGSAHRGLAWCAVLGVRLGWARDPAAAIAEAKIHMEAVKRGSSEPNGSVRSLEGIILLLEGRHAEAIEAGRSAVELLPGSADAWAVLAHSLTFVGRQDEALAAIERAMALSEIDPAWYSWTRGRALRMAGRFDEAISVLFPRIGEPPPSIVQLAELTASYAAAGRIVEARHTAERIRRIDPEFTAAAWLQHPPISVPEVQERELGYLSAAGL